MVSAEAMKNIVVCCDGTWCGDAAGTRSNIKILADSFAGQVVVESQTAVNPQTGTIVQYYSGIGLPASTLVDYVLDGVLANSIKGRCVEAYKFIVEHFDLDTKVRSRHSASGVEHGKLESEIQLIQSTVWQTGFRLHTSFNRTAHT
jgi:uncharacterized protein (DUF2235 family)